MHLRDFGSLLWVVIVIAGVVSSVRKAAGNAKVPSSARLGEPLPQEAAPAASAPKRRVAVTVNPQVAASLAGIDQAYRGLPTAPIPAPAAVFAEPALTAEPAEAAEQPVLTPAIASFADLAPAVPSQPVPARGRRTDWARGVVVAELLAPPLAMRESGPPTW
ncbi:MAG: hypothetical protein ACP5O6_05405 [Candidatus Baltobacteraceae bacterium]